MAEKNISKERRNQKRFKQKSVIKIDGKEAFLSDISENGIGIAVLSVPDKEFFPIKLSIGEHKFDLSGKLIWTGDSKSYTGLYDIGVTIEEPAEEYLLFIRSLNRENG